MSDTDTDADINGDGVVNGTDTNLIREIMNTTGVPGPGAVTSPTANTPPQISGIPVPQVAVGELYQFTPTISDEDGDDLGVTLSNGPSWLQWNAANSTLSGTALAENVGNHEVTITVNDGEAEAALNFSVEVSEASNGDDDDNDGFVNNNDNCINVYNPLQRDTNNNGYGNFCDGDLTGDGQITYDDVNRSYWYYNSYNANADINGDNTVNATDTSLVLDMMNTTGVPGPSGVVVEVNNPPTIYGLAPTTIEVGNTYNFTPQATDENGDTLTFSVTNLPGWLTFDAVTGNLSGAPTSADVGLSVNITLSVTDGTDITAMPSFSIEVTVVDTGNQQDKATEVQLPTGLNQLYMSPQGTDNDQCSETLPCRTFVATVAKMAAGDELILMDGVYAMSDHGGLDPTERNGSPIPNTALLPSGISLEQPTIVRAQNSGKVSIEGGLQIGRTSQKVQYVFVHGLVFHQGGSIFNGDYNVITDSGFEGGLSIGTIDHSQGNTYNHIEDVWVWSYDVRVTAINYRAHHNTWRRVIIRDDGCALDYCGEKVGNHSVGITVYNSHHVTLENVVVIDRILGENRFGYADFATAQHTSNQPAQPEGELLGNNQWLGCLSINSEDTALVFEADAVSTGTTATVRNFSVLGAASGVYFDPAHRPFSGISFFDIDNLDIYPTSGADRAFNVGCDVVSTTDPGCDHEIGTIRSGQFDGNQSSVLPQTRYGSSEALWPWVNEAQIKSDWCANTTRGLCGYDGTLSEYIHSF